MFKEDSSATAVIRNPVLRGFNPDPSFVRVGDDYYIATSTFEWLPGICIHHSKDLVHWRLIGHVLTRTSLVDLRGVTDSGGVWAPSLSYADGQFWLVYTNIRTRVGDFKDIGVYLTTAPDILGPWSEPAFLHSVGFDPSLFHDTDGRKWLVNMIWDFRKDRPRFGGIVVQEYDHTTRSLVGPLTNVLAKEVLTEGPNVYRRGDYYYLMLAEGGTGWNHGISMARARSITGPYELDPQQSVLTTRDDEAYEFQKAGHGELVETQSGEWYLAHLLSRPVMPSRRCVLGRETAIQKVRWSDDGWLRLEGGGTLPRREVPAPVGLPAHPWPAEPERDDFDAKALSLHWQSLRVPVEESWLTLKERPGWLRLRGRESLHSLFEQSLVAKRLRSLRCAAETCLEFEPENFMQMAGLVCWYDTRTHYYLRVTHDEARGKVLGVVLTDDGVYDELADDQVEVNDWPRVHLRAGIDGGRLEFLASPDGRWWRNVGPLLDASKLSDDYGQGLHFTGAFVGLCAQDLSGAKKAADFDYFEMKEGA
jgi:xylan 1,4-beta-xylosidase